MKTTLRLYAVRTCIVLAISFVALGVFNKAQSLVSTAPEKHEKHVFLDRVKDSKVTQDAASTAKKSLSENVQDMLQKTSSSGSSLLYFLLLAFLAGVLISFTPCVYPMIPITIGILHAQGSKSFLQNFFSAFSYVLGIACVYAILGYFAATASFIFGSWMANPWVIGFIALFFLYLAFSMFGFYEIYIPGFLTRKHGDVKARGSFVKTFLLGALSGTVASPCLTPALAVLLALVAKEANPLIGFLTLFVFAVGMGVLLILIGTFSGALAMLPRAGMWMQETKKIMGFAMLAVCVYFLQNFFEPHIILLLYGVVALAASIYYFASGSRHKIFILLGLFCLLGALLLFVMGGKSFILYILSMLGIHIFDGLLDSLPFM